MSLLLSFLTTIFLAATVIAAAGELDSSYPSCPASVFPKTIACNPSYSALDCLCPLRSQRQWGDILLVRISDECGAEDTEKFVDIAREQCATWSTTATFGWANPTKTAKGESSLDATSVTAISASQNERTEYVSTITPTPTLFTTSKSSPTDSANTTAEGETVDVNAGSSQRVELGSFLGFFVALVVAGGLLD